MLQHPPPRCGVCGHWHPLITVCPYIAEQEIREEYSGPKGERRLVRIIRTVYFPRRELAEASLASLEEEAEDAGRASPPPGADGQPPRRPVRGRRRATRISLDMRDRLSGTGGRPSRDAGGQA